MVVYFSSGSLLSPGFGAFDRGMLASAFDDVWTWGRDSTSGSESIIRSTSNASPSAWNRLRFLRNSLGKSQFVRVLFDGVVLPRSSCCRTGAMNLGHNLKHIS